MGRWLLEGKTFIKFLITRPIYFLSITPLSATGRPRNFVWTHLGCKLLGHSQLARCHMQDRRQHDQRKDPGWDSQDFQHQEWFHSSRRGTSPQGKHLVRGEVKQIPQSFAPLLHRSFQKRQIKLFLSFYSFFQFRYLMMSVFCVWVDWCWEDSHITKAAGCRLLTLNTASSN